MLKKSKDLATSWIPVFVFSKRHVRLELLSTALDSVGHILRYFVTLHTNSFAGDLDILVLLRFTSFLSEAAQFHRSCKASSDLGPDRPLKLVNESYIELLEAEIDIMGLRVLCGSIGAKQKTVKFLPQLQRCSKGVEQSERNFKNSGPSLQCTADEGLCSWPLCNCGRFHSSSESIYE